MSVPIIRKPVRFYPDAKRVIARFFLPHGDASAQALIEKVMLMSEADCQQVFNQILRNFSHRHRNITKIFEKSYDQLRENIKQAQFDPDRIPMTKKLIIGAYFTNEYSIESAAFFNPSIVEDPYQGSLPSGHKRIIVSFRATGEGHISSVAFRSGVIDDQGNLNFDAPGDLVDVPEMVTRHVYDKAVFLQKLDEMAIKKDVIPTVMDQLGDHFIYGELQAAIAKVLKDQDLSYSRRQVVQAINWLATSHYELSYSLDTAISERVIFPISYSESNGIEDARFVRFVDDDGGVRYYATYTAYNGYAVLSKLLETEDFYQFKVRPINGECATAKGMALFPRKIKGRYAMMSRCDGINNFIVFSDNINLWQSPQMIQQPLYPWELVQIGNSGSPIETEHGWLLITHGVGPMRAYSLGAVLLDLDDPTRVIGRLKEPLLTPNEEEREGYVPNVVYSCGSIVHNNELVIAYAMSDYGSAFAGVPMDALMDALVPKRRQPSRPASGKAPSTILVVDDEEAIRNVLQALLLDAGYRVVVAQDGVDALMKIAAEPVDLVISDVQMPNFDGIQLLEFMNEKGLDIPVVFYTGFPSEEREIRCLELGAAEFLRKPIDNRLLLLRVQALLRNRGSVSRSGSEQEAGKK